MAYDDDNGMPTPQQLKEQRTAEIDAHKVPCQYCGAKPNHPCVNKLTKRELRRFGAHQQRINDAKHATEIEDEELPF